MIVTINIGGVLVNFGYANAIYKPEPFYPHLLSVAQINEANQQETGSASFVLSLRARDLLGLNLRRSVQIYDKNLILQFEGLVSRIVFTNVITVTVDA